MRLLVFLALAACNSKERAPTELRLVTYNLNFGNPDVARTLDAIATANADVALLQEITPAFLEKQGLARVPTSGPPTWHYLVEGWDLLSGDIDHVMVDTRVIALDAVVLDLGTSDHRPVVARLRLP